MWILFSRNFPHFLIIYCKNIARTVDRKFEESKFRTSSCWQMERIGYKFCRKKIPIVVGINCRIYEGKPELREYVMRHLKWYHLLCIFPYSGHCRCIKSHTRCVASRSVKLRLHLVIVARCQLDNITSIAEQGCWGGCLTINHPPRHYSTCLIYIRALCSVLQRSAGRSSLLLENAQLTSISRHPSDLVMHGWRSNYRRS